MLLRKIEKEFTVVIVKLSTFEAEPSVDPEGPAVVNVRKSSLNVHISEKKTLVFVENWSNLLLVTCRTFVYSPTDGSCGSICIWKIRVLNIC